MAAAERSVHVRQVAWSHPDAVALREAMDAEIGPRYADRAESLPTPLEMAVVPHDLVYVGLGLLPGQPPVGHIALRRLGAEFEVKKLFVREEARGAGVGRALLHAAEAAARSLGGRRVILQTGDRQPDAVTLYERAGYRRIPIYAPYFGLPYSLCFEKLLPGADERL